MPLYTPKAMSRIPRTSLVAPDKEGNKSVKIKMPPIPR
jgi:hypothetical protein